MKYIKLFLLLISLIIFINARTTNINQSAKNLEKFHGETTFTVGNGIFIPLYFTMSGFAFNIGLQQRFSLNNRVEFQLRTDSNYYLIVAVPSFPNSYSYSDFGFKFNAVEYNKFNFSILLFNGIYGGYTAAQGETLGPYIGLNLIFSNEMKNKRVIYYGLSFEYKPNIYNAYIFYQNYLEGHIGTYYLNNMILKEFDIGFCLGFENNNKIIRRHEINFNIYTGTFLSFVSFSLSYSFTIGGRYNMQQKQITALD